jgi:predicted MPP superfamily phosphohydrolase
MKLAWLTDTHLNLINLSVRQEFYQKIINTQCHGVLISGDIAEAPCLEDILKEMMCFIQKPIYFVLGNHDYYRDEVNQIRKTMIALTKEQDNLFWLSGSDLQQLSKDTFLVGQDGWADGRLGNFNDSRVELNDSLLIADLFQAKILGRSQLQTKMQQLADLDASQLQEKITQALIKKPKTVIVLTHIPPFKEACWDNGKIASDDWLPYLASKASGDVLMSLCTKYHDVDFLVLCGHSHSQAKYSPLPNLKVEVGSAEEYKPEIQKIIAIN